MRSCGSRLGRRVRLWLGGPKTGAYHYGTVIGIDNVGRILGVEIRLDEPVKGWNTCYATHREVEWLPSSGTTSGGSETPGS